ncbi:MAG: SpoIIE family protein phosphatase [Desulfobacteraceae bacterium]|uniref:SpoIIE family protein phosphatase n=1 Tax=Candidatus Desulfaltia bathyphila TaxID=2841697 RepID=A0A8J6TB75_9BACT|nr:SpoIIE family protein phosphatase [Candidatus Desulfaltia bathyphila]
MKKVKPLVLIVDDNSINIDLLVNTLKNDYRLGIAKNGAKALEYADKYMPDLILLDIMMPEMNGYEVCTRLKAATKTKDIPVIFITAMSEEGHKTRGFEVGALDYITKPFHAAEVKARVKTHLSLKEARDQEIYIASRIQQTLLLGQPPHNIQGIQIAHLTAASQKIDGDFYDFFKHSDLCFDIVVGDVMGKGIPAALLGAALKSHLLRVLNELSLLINKDNPPEPAQIISSVHTQVIDQIEDLETFATLCYARFDMAKYMYSFVDCGHMRTIHFHNDTNNCSLLRGVNMPLGFPEKEPFRQKAVRFKPGDLFVFYSDGLTECKDRDGNLYGEKRLVDFVQINAKIEPENLINSIWNDIIAFSESETFDDDVTCVLVKIGKRASRSALSTESKLEIISDLKELERVRAFAREFCAGIKNYPLDAKRISMIELAVTEVTVNIIKHAYQSRTGETIQINAEASADEIEIRFYDQGERFEPKSVPQPVFGGSRESGFGLHIIAHTVDEVIYSRDDQGRNCACLKIKLTGGN